jgi:hypothetical protein
MRSANRLAITALMITGLLAACYKTETSATLTEPGRIEQMTWTPSNSGSGAGIGVDPSSGNAVVVSTSVYLPEKYAIVISCLHGKFSLNPDGENARRIFAHFKQGDSITIHYTEVYHRRGDQRELYKLDFLDATRR